MADCSPDESNVGTKKAIERNDQLEAAGASRIKHAYVDVTIKEITGDTVVLSTRGEDNHRHDFRVAKSLVWLECPSTATNDGDAGRLLISKEGLGTLSTAGNGDAGVRILGSTPDSADSTRLIVKWPDGGGLFDIATTALRIWPTSIVVEGYAIDDPEFHSGTVELLDPSVAGFQQEIDLSRGAEISLNLTSNGLGAFQMGGDIDELRHAVELVLKPFNDDAKARAKAWRVIARYREVSEWFNGHGGGGPPSTPPPSNSPPSKPPPGVTEIDAVMAGLKGESRI